jgi:hypothetical protein
MRPPISPSEDFPSAPAESPPSFWTPSPTDESSFAVELPVYALTYEVLEPRVPTREELEALAAITSLYLEQFMFNEFDGNTFTILDDFITELLTASFVAERPIEVDYMSVARFNAFSNIIPTETQLNSALIDAFSGLNMLEYEKMLSDNLPSDNVFVGSTVLFVQEPIGEIPDASRSGIGATGIAAAAVAFTLLVAGVVIYKRRNEGVELETDKLNKTGADMTVAGETFTGETYDGTASISGASMDYVRRYQDDDESKNFNLGTINENTDASSVAPWEEGRGENVGSFEDVALQGPTHGGFNSPPSMDESSQISEPELSQLTSSVGNHGKGNKVEIKPLTSFDSLEGKSPSIHSALSVRDNSSRRPRTVSEIEQLLSADINSAGNLREELEDQPTNRPRTVEEIESLLQADLADESTLEAPFSDEDDTIGAEDE